MGGGRRKSFSLPHVPPHNVRSRIGLSVGGVTTRLFENTDHSFIKRTLYGCAAASLVDLHIRADDQGQVCHVIRSDRVSPAGAGHQAKSGDQVSTIASLRVVNSLDHVHEIGRRIQIDPSRTGRELNESLTKRRLLGDPDPKA